MEGLAWEAILAAGTFFFLGAISPGPSVMVVIRNTIIGGRSQGVACAIGHGIGFGIYAGSAVFGLIVLLENAPDAFLILQLIGVGLLIWYGYLMWNDDVNLDDEGEIDPSKILGRYNYSHPVFSLDSVAAAERWEDVNGVNRTWFCGAYWANGFHEDGCSSGIRVAKALGAQW